MVRARARDLMGPYSLAPRLRMSGSEVHTSLPTAQMPPRLDTLSSIADTLQARGPSRNFAKEREPHGLGTYC